MFGHYMLLIPFDPWALDLQGSKVDVGNIALPAMWGFYVGYK
jgi:hypothetical protein